MCRQPGERIMLQSTAFRSIYSLVGCSNEEPIKTANIRNRVSPHPLLESDYFLTGPLILFSRKNTVCHADKPQNNCHWYLHCYLPPNNVQWIRYQFVQWYLISMSWLSFRGWCILYSPPLGDLRTILAKFIEHPPNLSKTESTVQEWDPRSNFLFSIFRVGSSRMTFRSPSHGL